RTPAAYALRLTPGRRVARGRRPAHGGLEPRRRLLDGAAALGVALDEPALEALQVYLAELLAWNRRLNLVGEHDVATLVDRHLVDSLAAVPVLSALGPGLRIADLGSGAGLPGIPLAIALRPAEMVLAEPRQKRASFLRAAARWLPAYALRVVTRNAAELAALEAGRFDAVVSRAALPEDDLVTVAAALVRAGGLLVSFRGAEPPLDVVSDAFAPPHIRPYALPGARRTFTLLIRERRFT
ncbi:MAG: 16S rRNA (guanine(527)-N(7))-methyltransferase RsmG, partial [Thermodesulfobacteriota bacterium]